MNLIEYASAITNSTENDWNIITCWGFSSGPSYLDRSSVWTTGKGDLHNIDIESHGMVAALKSNLSISIAWGMISNPEFKEDWANNFSDPSASSYIVDFFYNRSLIFRDIYVSVDGHRCKLPLPDRVFDKSTNQVIRYTVPNDKFRFFEMLDKFEQVSEFSRYFEEAGFETINSPWMQ
jgi:hypothetical protein